MKFCQEKDIAKQKFGGQGKRTGGGGVGGGVGKGFGDLKKKTIIKQVTTEA